MKQATAVIKILAFGLVVMTIFKAVDAVVENKQTLQTHFPHWPHLSLSLRGQRRPGIDTLQRKLGLDIPSELLNSEFNTTAATFVENQGGQDAKNNNFFYRRFKVIKASSSVRSSSLADRVCDLVDLTTSASTLTAEIPTSFDAREAFGDCISPVMDQGLCGSCWAFTTAQVLSDRQCIAAAKLNRTVSRLLSPQQLVACDHECINFDQLLGCDQGCKGGNLHSPWMYTATYGLVGHSCFPYTSLSGVTGSCPTEGTSEANNTSTSASSNLGHVRGLVLKLRRFPKLETSSTGFPLPPFLKYGLSLRDTANLTTALSENNVVVARSPGLIPHPTPLNLNVKQSKKQTSLSWPSSTVPTCSNSYQASNCTRRLSSTHLPCSKRVYKSGLCYQLSNVQSIQLEIMTKGSVMAGMVAYEDFMMYESGIYIHNPSSISYGGHAVRIIGWGTTNSNVGASSFNNDILSLSNNRTIDKSWKKNEATTTSTTKIDYWIVANQWGVDWGQDGYAFVRRGTNEAYLESMVVAADAIVPDGPDEYEPYTIALESDSASSSISQASHTCTSSSSIPLLFSLVPITWLMDLWD